MARIAILAPQLNMFGGTLVQFDLAKTMVAKGHEVSLVYYSDDPNLSREYFKGFSLTPLSSAHEEEYDAAIFSYWPMGYWMPYIRARNKVYYVQSLEFRFYTKDNVILRAAAANTYRMGFETITIAPWLSKALEEDFGVSSQVCRYGISKEDFSPHGPVTEPLPHDLLRLLVEGPIDTPLKNTDHSMEVARQSAADEVWLLTSSHITSHRLADRVFSRQKRGDVAAIMRSCSALLKLSFVEGQPLPPIEMAHCGRPSIVSNLEPYAEYLRNGENGFIVEEPYGSGALEAIGRLKQQQSLVTTMGERARASVQTWRSVEAAGEEFCDLIEALMRRPPTSLRTSTSSYARHKSVANDFLAGANKSPFWERVSRKISSANGGLARKKSGEFRRSMWV